MVTLWIISSTFSAYSTYEKVLITGDFNAQKGKKCLDTGTCYRNPNKPSCIDLILTNSPRRFFDTETCFTELSDCNNIVLSVFKTKFFKTGTKEMMCRDYKNFDQEIFSQELRTSLPSETVHDYNSFEENFLGVLNKHAPLKEKVLCANHAPYVTC